MERIVLVSDWLEFPISRDPPEGGTGKNLQPGEVILPGFQFLGIPPKGEHEVVGVVLLIAPRFQFLGIPPKGEQADLTSPNQQHPGVSNF